jgi:hypothetical protein
LKELGEKTFLLKDDKKRFECYDLFYSVIGEYDNTSYLYSNKETVSKQFKKQVDKRRKAKARYEKIKNKVMAANTPAPGPGYDFVDEDDNYDDNEQAFEDII